MNMADADPEFIGIVARFFASISVGIGISLNHDEQFLEQRMEASQ
jgi:hypothetical protein